MTFETSPLVDKYAWNIRKAQGRNFAIASSRFKKTSVRREIRIALPLTTYIPKSTIARRKSCEVDSNAISKNLRFVN